jgi:O-antigen ligase
MIPNKAKDFGLLFLAISLPLTHVPVQFAVVFLLGVALYLRRTDKNVATPTHIVLKVVAGFVTWNLFCAVVSPRPLHSIWATIDNEWPSITMIVLLWLINDVRELRMVLRAFFYSATIVAVYSVVTAFGGYDYVKHKALDPMGDHFFRGAGFFGLYLTYAAHAMNVFFLSAAYCAEESREERRKFLYLPFLVLAAIVLTFARSIWLAVVVLLPVAAVVRWRRESWRIIVPAFLVVVILITAVPEIRDRASSIVGVSQNETRLNLWKTAVLMFKDRPIIGIGEDNWDYYFEQYRTPGFYDTTVHAHNDYLTELVNGGIPGFTMFCVIWFLIIRIGFRTWKNSTDRLIRAVSLGGSFGILGLMIGSLFQNYYGTFINCFGWWFLAGLVLVAEKVNRLTETQISS